MSAEKCAHKGCGKLFTDSEEPCTYHPGPAVFHEGQKGYRCCKPRVLTFDEFLAIPPCATGKHSTKDDSALIYEKPREELSGSLAQASAPKSQSTAPTTPPVPRIPHPAQSRGQTPPPPPPPESEDDDPAASIPAGAKCRRRGCAGTYNPAAGRETESCVHHPGAPIFHEGSKGYSCCKRRVLEFDQFLQLEGCRKKARHLFVGPRRVGGKSGEGGRAGGTGAAATATGAGDDGGGGGSGSAGQGEELERLESVRMDFYQTSTQVMASLYLKRIAQEASTVEFSGPSSVQLRLRTSDGKVYEKALELWGSTVPEKNTAKILGTKLELTLVKADGAGWPVLRREDPRTGEIIQAGRAGRV